MITISDGDIKMLVTFIIFIVLDSTVVWVVQIFQDTLGRLTTIISRYIHFTIFYEGSIRIRFIQYLLTFVFDLFWFTVYPWVVLLNSREDYHQIWTDDSPCKEVKTEITVK